jgi:hypothetical protein
MIALLFNFNGKNNLCIADMVIKLAESQPSAFISYNKLICLRYWLSFELPAIQLSTLKLFPIHYRHVGKA